MILDEGQYIKNPASITAQIARGLKARYRLVLSGTPIENKLLDLWSLMGFAMPGALGSRAEFADCSTPRGHPRPAAPRGPVSGPSCSGAPKTQVAKDLPDRIGRISSVELEGKDALSRRVEARQAMLLRVNTPAALAKHQFNFLTSLLRLRQICCHPRLAKPDSKAESARRKPCWKPSNP